MREGDPTKTDDTSLAGQDEASYNGPGHARSLCVVWPDGKRMFFNYAYLVCGELDVAGDKNVIRLEFSGSTLKLIGFGLEALFMSMLEQVPRIIIAIDERYVLNDIPPEAIVIGISVEKKE